MTGTTRTNLGTKTFWLSFCDEDKPKGQQFLGVCVIDVTEAEAVTAKAKLDTMHPTHMDGAEWIAAATRLSWLHGCNPGGQVASWEVVIENDEQRATLARTPRNVLMSKAELRTLGLI